MKEQIYKKRCEICEKIFESRSESQLAYNFKLHKDACKKKLLRRENAGYGMPKNSKNKSENLQNGTKIN